MRRPVTGSLRCKGAVALFSAPKFLCNGPVVTDGASSSRVLTLQSLNVSCHTLGFQACGYKQDLGQRLDHVLAQAGEGL